MKLDSEQMLVVRISKAYSSQYSLILLSDGKVKAHKRTKVFNKIFFVKKRVAQLTPHEMVNLQERLEKMGPFDGTKGSFLGGWDIMFTYQGKTEYFSYDMSINPVYNDIVDILIEKAPIPITDIDGYLIEKAQFYSGYEDEPS